MRGSKLVLAAGLAAALAGCSSKKSSTKAPPATPDGVAATGGAKGPAVPPPPDPATEGAVAPSPGSTAPDPSFELTVEQPAAVAAAASATTRLVVHPGPGMKMNTDYPTGLTLTPPAGVTLPKATFAATDAATFDHKELAFSVSMSAAAPGAYKVPGTFKFAVCDEGACYPKKRAVELVLAVQ